MPAARTKAVTSRGGHGPYSGGSARRTVICPISPVARCRSFTMQSWLKNSQSLAVLKVASTRPGEPSMGTSAMVDS